MYPDIAQLYLLRTLSSLHVGKGETGYGIVDKQVQRDPITSLPNIHASGLKGAFRELFRHHLREKQSGPDPDQHPLIRHIFGNAVHSTKEPDAEGSVNFSAGSHHFHEGRLLSLPARSDKAPWFSVTSPSVLNEFLSQVDLLGVQLDDKVREAFQALASIKVTDPLIFDSKWEGAIMEEFGWEAKNGAQRLEAKSLALLNPYLGDRIALVADDALKALASRLPVIARNHLENGISKNLWYEEVVPRETRFYFFLRRPKASPGDTIAPKMLEGYKDVTLSFQSFIETCAKSSVQIGGNATVGYGLCHIQPLHS